LEDAYLNKLVMMKLFSSQAGTSLVPVQVGTSLVPVQAGTSLVPVQEDWKKVNKYK